MSSLQVGKPLQAVSSARALHQRTARRAAELSARASVDQVARRELAELLERAARERVARGRRDRECIVGIRDCPICGTGVYAPR